jgi:hypothetical protein
MTILENAPHKLKFAIRRYEADRACRIEVVQPHALVESTIVELHRVANAPLALVDYKFVI